MRKVLSILCGLILALLFPLATLVSRGLPVDSSSHIAQKYAGWSGVLQAWVCCEWKPGGSFISWLNGCAAAFEKEHSGVYIEFIPVDAGAMAAMQSGGIRMPDLLFFSPGVLRDASGLAEIAVPDCLRSDLAGCSEGRALPVAMGGSIWAYNRALADGPVYPPLTLAAGDGAAAIGLMSDPAGESEADIPEPGLDLGLPASASAGEALVIAENALDRFINGELPCLPVDQADIARLNRLRENGRGPDWACAAAGRFACTDRLLLAALTETDDADRRALAAEFTAFLYDEQCQAALAEAGACSVTGALIHSDFSPYAELDRLLNSRSLLVPRAFSEYSQHGEEAIVRAFLSGQCSAERAAAELGFIGALPNTPN